MEKVTGEDKNLDSIRSLFQELIQLTKLESKEAISLLKSNRKTDGLLTISELVDAFWWCLFSRLYKNYSNDCLKSSELESYLLKPELFREDIICIIECERLRLMSNSHRFPKFSAQQRKGRKSQELQKRHLQSYKELIDYVSSLTKSEETKDLFGVSKLVKVCFEKIRLSQEQLLGFDLNTMSQERKSQFYNIARLVDAMFIHKYFVSRSRAEGGEMLTQEEADQYHEAYSIVKTICSNTRIPYFIRNLTEMESVVLVPFSQLSF